MIARCSVWASALRVTWVHWRCSLGSHRLRHGEKLGGALFHISIQPKGWVEDVEGRWVLMVAQRKLGKEIEADGEDDELLILLPMMTY